MVLNRQREVRVSLLPLERFLLRAKKTVSLPRSEMTVCLVSDSEMQRLNRSYRRKNKPTDVLSFPAGSSADYLGDIAISPATARRNAAKNGRTLPQELRILILHGLLHLMGYDHQTDQGEMDRLESKFRRRLGLA